MIVRAFTAIGVQAVALGFVIFSLASNPAQASPADELNAVADKLVQVCGGGLDHSVSVELAGRLKNDGFRGGPEIRRSIRASILNSVSTADKERAYRDYLECVSDTLSQFYSDDSGDLSDQVEIVSTNIKWRPAGTFSSYDWVADYEYVVRNNSFYAVECKLVADGYLERRSTDAKARDGEHNSSNFSLDPGENREVDGDVGVNGFNDNDHQVTMDKELNCWKA
jgi:hypothetical protein